MGVQQCDGQYGNIFHEGNLEHATYRKDRYSERVHNDYIILATDDDTFEPDFLSEATRIIEKYPHSDLFRSGVKKIGEKGQILDEEFPLKEYLTSREFTLCWAKGLTISCVSNYIFRKCALDRIGGFISFPHAHFSDDATALAIAKNGVANMPGNFMNFRMSTINLSNQGDYRTAINQIIATDQYMGWYLKHVAELDTIPNDYFEKACYGGCKSKCTGLIEKLSAKIAISKSFLLFRTLLSLKHLFKNEKIKLCVNYFINKL